MKRTLFTCCLLAGLLPVYGGMAIELKPSLIRTLLVTDKTVTGQPIELTAQPEIHVSTYHLAAGRHLPTNKHPYQRFSYVLDGAITLVNMQGEIPKTAHYEAGDFFVEMRDEWHYGETAGKAPASVLILDIVPPNTTSNMVLQNKVTKLKPAKTAPQVFSTTASGEPLIMPITAEVRAMIYEIGSGKSFPAHRHPYPRLVYVLSGAFDSIDSETHEIRRLKTGDFTIDPVERMHYAENNNDETVRLLVLDIVPPGSPSNTVLGSQAN